MSTVVLVAGGIDAIADVWKAVPTAGIAVAGVLFSAFVCVCDRCFKRIAGDVDGGPRRSELIILFEQHRQVGRSRTRVHCSSSTASGSAPAPLSLGRLFPKPAFVRAAALLLFTACTEACHGKTQTRGTLGSRRTCGRTKVAAATSYCAKADPAQPAAHGACVHRIIISTIEACGVLASE